jgi:hypothetical protein
MTNSDKFDLFDNLISQDVPVRPKGGTGYHYSWIDVSKSEDWRADGYRWRQNGPHRPLKCDNGELRRMRFHVSIHDRLYYSLYSSLELSMLMLDVI